MQRIGSYIEPRDLNRVTTFKFPDGSIVDVRPVSQGRSPIVRNPQ